MYIIKYLTILVFVATSLISFSQNSNAQALSQQASICLKASSTLELIVNAKNMGMESKYMYGYIVDANLPIAQQNNLNGLIPLLYSTKNLTNSTEQLNSKQIAINYYLSCMSVK